MRINRSLLRENQAREISYSTRALIGLVPIQVYIEPIVWPTSVREAFEQCEIVAHAFYYDMDSAFNTFHVLGSLWEGSVIQ
jgi:hypothetical protein